MDEVVSSASLIVVAGEVRGAAAGAGTYAGVYRNFCAFWMSTPTRRLGADGACVPQGAASAGRSQATIAKHVSALRSPADAFGSDAAVRHVRSETVGTGEPRAPTHEKYERLLRMPDAAAALSTTPQVLAACLGEAIPRWCARTCLERSWWTSAYSTCRA